MKHIEGIIGVEYVIFIYYIFFINPDVFLKWIALTEWFEKKVTTLVFS